MAISFIQPSFAAGEIAPSLYARVDLAKYHIAAKLLRNFFVHAHGGVSNRAGTMFVGRSWNDNPAVGCPLNPVTNLTYSPQLIPFQFNLLQAYVLEFGHQYMRVIMNGGYVLEPSQSIVGVTNANPGVITVGGPGSGAQLECVYGPGTLLSSVTVVNGGSGYYTDVTLTPPGGGMGAVLVPGIVDGVITYVLVIYPGDGYSGTDVMITQATTYSNGDEVFISGTGTQLDSTPGKTYLVANLSGNTFTLTDLDGNAIDTTNFTAYGGSGGTIARVFTMSTPYSGSDVQLIKWTQSADTLTLCHPNYPPQDLTRTDHWVWTLTPISFAPQVSPPSGVSFTNNGPSTGSTVTWYFSYVVTAVTDSPPEESYASACHTGSGYQLNSNIGVMNTITWKANTNAVMYRIYKANPTITGIPSGAMYGYIGTATGTSFQDVEIAPDFTQTPPQGTNPFNEGPISEVTVVNQGSGYTSDITLWIGDVSGTGAVLKPVLASDGSGGYKITDVTVVKSGQGYQNPTVHVGNLGSGAAGHINVKIAMGISLVTATVDSGGQDYHGIVAITATSGGTGCTFKAIITNGVITSIEVLGEGTGYTDGDTLVFTERSGTGATFNVSITPSGNYPSCCTYFQQRKVFAGSNINPQTIWMTQPADFKSMDVSNPSKASDAITMTIAANQVNAIKWLVPMNNLVIMSSGGAWLLIGGAITQPVAVTPTNTVVVPQNYIGCGDLPPIVINYDILYVQAKGSIVRDLAYNFWVNVYTGTDMSVLANHLFFGHNLERWAYAEQPFYQLWVVRDDGVLLSLTYLKEQDVYAWAHHDSPGSSGTDKFLSVASIPEQQIPGLNVDSVYFVTQRTIPGINGGSPVKYVERMHCRNFLTNGAADVTKAWFVDCGLQYNGNPVSAGGNGLGPVLSLSGLDHLNGATVSILADGNVQQQVVTGGAISLPYAASTVTVGLPYVSQMETLCMEPEGMAVQVQDYRKKISAVAVRVADTRGLKVGPNFNDLTEIKERSANVAMGSAIALFTGDERVVIDSQYLVDDDVCIEQDNPLPCTILGVIPSVSIGDAPG